MSGSGGAVSAAVIVLGLLTGLALAAPSLDYAMDELKEARSGIAYELVEIKGTDFSIGPSVFNATRGELNITIVNTGSTVIDLDQLVVLVNGTLRETTHDGGRFLYPGGSVIIVSKESDEPGTVRAVGPWGIAEQTNDVTKES